MKGNPFAPRLFDVKKPRLVRVKVKQKIFFIAFKELSFEANKINFFEGESPILMYWSHGLPS